MCNFLARRISHSKNRIQCNVCNNIEITLTNWYHQIWEINPIFNICRFYSVGWQWDGEEVEQTEWLQFRYQSDLPSSVDLSDTFTTRLSITVSRITSQKFKNTVLFKFKNSAATSGLHTPLCTLAGMGWMDGTEPTNCNNGKTKTTLYKTVWPTTPKILLLPYKTTQKPMLHVECAT